MIVAGRFGGSAMTEVERRRLARLLVEGLSGEQIADRLGIPEDAVRSAVRQLLRDLVRS